MSGFGNKFGLRSQKKFVLKAKLLSLGRDMCRISIGRIEKKPNLFTILSPAMVSPRNFSFSHIAFRKLNIDSNNFSSVTPMLPKKAPLSSTTILQKPQIVRSPRISVIKSGINLNKCTSEKVFEEPSPPKGLVCVKLFNELLKFAKQRKDDVKQLLNFSYKDSTLALLPTSGRQLSMLEKAKEKEMLRVPIENEILAKLQGANIEDRDTRRQIIMNIKELVISFEAVRKHYKLDSIKERESPSVQDQVSR